MVPAPGEDSLLEARWPEGGRGMGRERCASPGPPGWDPGEAAVLPPPIPGAARLRLRAVAALSRPGGCLFAPFPSGASQAVHRGPGTPRRGQGRNSGEASTQALDGWEQSEESSQCLARPRRVRLPGLWKLTPHEKAASPAGSSSGWRFSVLTGKPVRISHHLLLESRTVFG